LGKEGKRGELQKQAHDLDITSSLCREQRNTAEDQTRALSHKKKRGRKGGGPVHFWLLKFTQKKRMREYGRKNRRLEKIRPIETKPKKRELAR